MTEPFAGPDVTEAGYRERLEAGHRPPPAHDTCGRCGRQDPAYLVWSIPRQAWVCPVCSLADPPDDAA